MTKSNPNFFIFRIKHEPKSNKFSFWMPHFLEDKNLRRTQLAVTL